MGPVAEQLNRNWSEEKKMRQRRDLKVSVPFWRKLNQLVFYLNKWILCGSQTKKVAFTHTHILKVVHSLLCETNPVTVLQCRRGLWYDWHWSPQTLNHGYHCVGHPGGIGTLILPAGQCDGQHLLGLWGKVQKLFKGRKAKQGKLPFKRSVLFFVKQINTFIQ